MISAIDDPLRQTDQSLLEAQPREGIGVRSIPSDRFGRIFAAHVGSVATPFGVLLSHFRPRESTTLPEPSQRSVHQLPLLARHFEGDARRQVRQAVALLARATSPVPPGVLRLRDHVVARALQVGREGEPLFLRLRNCDEEKLSQDPIGKLPMPECFDEERQFLELAAEGERLVSGRSRDLQNALQVGERGWEPELQVVAITNELCEALQELDARAIAGRDEPHHLFVEHLRAGEHDASKCSGGSLSVGPQSVGPQSVGRRVLGSVLSESCDSTLAECSHCVILFGVSVAMIMVLLSRYASRSKRNGRSGGVGFNYE